MTDPILDALARRFEKPLVEPDPVLWAKKTLNVDLWSKQREILRLLEICPKVAVPSCHDAGKSFIAALATARFLAKYPPGTARVVTTAPSVTQVRTILWNEINAMHERSNGQLPGRVNQTEWWIGSWNAGIGRKPSDYAPETFQGLHAQHILVIVDEAGGIPDDLWTGVDTITTNPGAKILAIGNPDDPQAKFKTICENAPENGWMVVQIPAWETPNLSGESVPQKLSENLLSATWVEEKRLQWGEDSALWQSKIAAEFPIEGGMTVVRLADVQAALQGDELMPSIRWAAQVQLGVDIAASDLGDKTVIRERRGNMILRRWEVQSGEPEDISDLIVQAWRDTGATLIHVDATGVGLGFIADVRRRLPGVAVLPFIAAGQATDHKQFENRRAEAHWYIRERLRHRELDMSQMQESDDHEALSTTAQLLAIRYSIKKGRIIVEPKDGIRKRLGRSPDDSDALLLSVLPPLGAGIPVPATVRATTRSRVQTQQVAREATGTHAAPVNPYGPRPIPERIIPPSGRGGRIVRPRSIRAVG